MTLFAGLDFLPTTHAPRIELSYDPQPVKPLLFRHRVLSIPIYSISYN